MYMGYTPPKNISLPSNSIPYQVQLESEVLFMDSQNQLAKILKKARMKAKLTQAQVAEKADITTNYYARIERGEVNPTVDVVMYGLSITTSSLQVFRSFKNWA